MGPKSEIINKFRSFFGVFFLSFVFFNKTYRTTYKGQIMKAWFLVENYLSNLPGPGLNKAFESTTGRTSVEAIKARESEAVNFVEFWYISFGVGECGFEVS